MRLTLIQLRCRPAMRWPSDPSLDHAASSGSDIGEAALWPGRKASRPCPRGRPNAVTASPVRPMNIRASSLRDEDLRLEASQQSLRRGEGQASLGRSDAQIYDIGEIMMPVDPHDVGAPFPTVSLHFHQTSRSKPGVYPQSQSKRRCLPPHANTHPRPALRLPPYPHFTGNSPRIAHRVYTRQTTNDALVGLLQMRVGAGSHDGPGGGLADGKKRSLIPIGSPRSGCSIEGAAGDLIQPDQKCSGHVAAFVH
jgi:hypothetical protein